MDTMVDKGGDINPLVIGDKVPDEAATGSREQALIGLLKIIKEDRLLSVRPMDMAKDVQPGLDAPNLA